MFRRRILLNIIFLTYFLCGLSTISQGTIITTDYVFSGTVEDLSPWSSWGKTGPVPVINIGDSVKGTFTYSYDTDRTYTGNNCGTYTSYGYGADITKFSLILDDLIVPTQGSGDEQWVYNNDPDRGDVFDFRDYTVETDGTYPTWIESLGFHIFFSPDTFNSMSLPTEFEVANINKVTCEFMLYSSFDYFYSGMEVNLNFDKLTPAPVPEPATLLLLGTGLIGLAGFRKKLM